MIDTSELDIPGFAENPPDRCYLCKKSIFGEIMAFAQADGFSAGIAGPLLTTPGADFDDDRELALQAGYSVSAKTAGC